MKFVPEHFPKGTVAEIKVTESEPKLFTVDHILQNGARSFIIVSPDDDLSFPGINMKKMVNIYWVTKIISRGTGNLDIRTYSQYSAVYDKNPRYGITSWNILQIVGPIVSEYLGKYDMLDNKKLADRLFSSHILKPSRTDDYYMKYTVNKKRLKKHIKRLVPHCLIPIKKILSEEKAKNERLCQDLYLDW